MKFAIRRADTTNYAIYRKRSAHVMKSALRQVRMADLISSEAIGGRFHPSSLGFHPAKQDFIKFVWFVGIVFVLASLFCFSHKKINRSLYTPFVQFMGYRSIIDSLKRIIDFQWIM